MIRISIIYSLVILCSYTTHAQADSVQLKNIFEKIQTEAKSYKLDTTDAPQDKATKLILELRKLRGGFNINEAIQYQMQEEAAKQTAGNNAVNEYLQQEFTTGTAGRWLNNAVVHIYRDMFSTNELKQLVKFYRTDAGQKFASALPMIMVKTLMAAETIKTLISKPPDNR